MDSTNAVEGGDLQRCTGASPPISLLLIGPSGRTAQLPRMREGGTNTVQLEVGSSDRTSTCATDWSQDLIVDLSLFTQSLQISTNEERNVGTFSSLNCHLRFNCPNRFGRCLKIQYVIGVTNGITKNTHWQMWLVWGCQLQDSIKL